MDAGQWAAIASSAVSVVALGAASWLSVRAARAAEKSAEASRRAAAASEASVSVAVESLSITREQATRDRKRTDKADSPVFRVEVEPVSYFMWAVTATMVAGPHTVDAEVEVRSEMLAVPFAVNGEGHLERLTESVKSLHLGGEVFLHGGTASGPEGVDHLFSVTCTVTIDTREDEEPHRSWRTVQVVEWNELNDPDRFRDDLRPRYEH